MTQRRPQEGLTIAELLVSLGLGLLVSMAAIGLLLSSRAVYLQHEEAVRLHETGRFALEAVARAVRQAGFEDWGAESAPDDAGGATAAIAGLDARSLSERGYGIAQPLPPASLGSDVLALRFAGGGAPPGGDGTMTDCAGFGVPAHPGNADARGWSIFHVGIGPDGEPELRCKYRAASGAFASAAIAGGIESFQVLYGLDLDADGTPERYVNATAIDRLDATIVLAGDTDEARSRDFRRRTHWRRVAAVRIALLVRSLRAGTDGDGVYDLFGAAYGAAHGAEDAGTRVAVHALPARERGRLRRVFAQTVMLRNRVSGDRP